MRPFRAASCAALVIAAAAGRAGAGDAKKPKLVPANFNAIQDQMGFRWDFAPNGQVNDGTNDCFDGGLALHIGGARFASNKPMMVPGTNEYVLEKAKGDMKVTRRILVDKKRGAARYLEVFENTGSKKQDIAISLQTRLGGSQTQLFTSAGKPFAGKLSNKDAGLIAVRSDQRPGVMFLVTGRGAKVRPTATVANNNRNVNFNFQLKIPPKKTVTILHFVAQRTGATGQSAPSVFKTFYKGRPLKPRVPKALAGTIVNFGRVSGAAGDDGGTSAVSELADSFGVELGERDTLVMNEDAVLTGAVRCAVLAIETSRGRVEIPFGEVAAVAGGAGTGRPGRLYMRTGEVLAGRIEARGLELETKRFRFALRPEQVNLLFARASKADGKPPDGADAFLTTRLGEKLAVRGAGVVLEAATPWGTFSVPLDEVEGLSRRDEGQPLHRLALKSGSRLSVILTGGDVVLDTTRFGAISLPPNEIASLARIPKEKPQPPAPAEAEESAEEAPEEPPSASLPEDVRKKLSKECKFAVTDIPLGGAVQLIARSAGMHVKLDLGSDEETTRASGQKVNLQADGTPILAVLDGLAREQGMVLEWRDGGVVLTRPPGEAGGEDEEEEDEGPKAPQCTLAGDDVLVGEIDLPEIAVTTDAGPTNVVTADVIVMERAEDSDGFRVAFTFELAGGDKLTGCLEEAVLPIRAEGRVLRVPVEHLASFKRPRPPEADAGGDEEKEEPETGEEDGADSLEGPAPEKTLVIPMQLVP